MGRRIQTLFFVLFFVWRTVSPSLTDVFPTKNFWMSYISHKESFVPSCSWSNYLISKKTNCLIYLFWRLFFRSFLLCVWPVVWWWTRTDYFYRARRPSVFNAVYAMRPAAKGSEVVMNWVSVRLKWFHFVGATLTRRAVHASRGPCLLLSRVGTGHNI